MSPLGLYVSFILINVSKRNRDVSKAEYCNYVKKKPMDTVQTKSLMLGLNKFFILINISNFDFNP